MDPIEPTFNTSLEELIEHETLAEVFANFLVTFHIPLRIFNANNDLILEKTIENQACKYLNGFTKSRNQCLVIRQRVKSTEFKSPQTSPVTVTCFCGFEYLILPILFQSKILGKLVIGPFFPKTLDKIPDQCLSLDSNIDVQRLKETYTRLPRYPHKKIIQLADIVKSTLDCIFFAVHKTNITSHMHTAMIAESYRELSEQNRKLEEISDQKKEFDRRKSNFLSMVSHELRTPLTSIIGYSDMLTEGIAGTLTAEQKQFIETIKNKGDDLLKIISSILDFSQVDSGHLRVNLAPSDIHDIIRLALEKNKEMYERRGVKVSVNIADAIPSIQLDPEKITTALSHLIDNAIKFSAPGAGVRVTAKIMASSEDDVAEDGFGFVLLATPDMLEISVEDFGMGIETDNVEALFAPFTQADQSSTREHGGAGMGLAIVKQYVEAHGGRVHVHSTKGEGSNFAIRLPIVESV
ncbi:MAG: PocR ligand-binding domain-containing protein [Deltaproteobacteria bacterium]|nr:PocR ligand-binding domain-containing protein [Deltaproteobacteria bacterium]